MTHTTLNLAEAIANNFATCNREQLEAFAEMMEIDFHPNIADERLRDRMLDRIGKTLNQGEPLEISSDPSAEAFEVRAPDKYTTKDLNELMALNLTPNGKWEGRRRKVSVPKPENLKGQQAHPFSWGKHMVMVPWNVPVSVPYPIYEILRNGQSFQIEQERTTDKRGTPKIINHRVEEMRFRYADMGDDPETLNRPTSQREQFRKVAEATEYFKDWNRAQLARLCKRLALRYERGIDTAEIRDLVLRSLRYDPDMLEDGVFIDEAVA